MENEFKMPEGYQLSFIKEPGTQWKEIEYWSEVTKTIRKANVILPADYDKSKKYPVVYLLHGIGGDENEWKQAGPEYILGNLMGEKKVSSMIIVLPNVRARGNDIGNPADIFTMEHFGAFDRFAQDLKNHLIPYMKEYFSILDGRENTAIAGLSMGGREALYIGLSMQEEFGYIGAFSPAFGIFPYTNNGVTENGLFRKENFCLQEEFKDNSFLMIMTGDEDFVVMNEPVRYHEALEENGTKHVFYTVPGGHDFQVWSQGLYYFLNQIFK